MCRRSPYRNGWPYRGLTAGDLQPFAADISFKIVATVGGIDGIILFTDDPGGGEDLGSGFGAFFLQVSRFKGAGDDQCAMRAGDEVGGDLCGWGVSDGVDMGIVIVSPDDIVRGIGERACLVAQEEVENIGHFCAKIRHDGMSRCRLFAVECRWGQVVAPSTKQGDL